jgi:hypothetical protein
MNGSEILKRRRGMISLDRPQPAGEGLARRAWVGVGRRLLVGQPLQHFLALTEEAQIGVLQSRPHQGHAPSSQKGRRWIGLQSSQGVLAAVANWLVFSDPAPPAPPAMTVAPIRTSDGMFGDIGGRPTDATVH